MGRPDSVFTKKDTQCSLLANAHNLEFRENIEGIDEWPHNWPDGEISYRLNNFSDDFSRQWQKRAVTVALRAWQLRITKLKFRRERNPDVSVDFNVSFEDLAHFDNRKGVFAHAYFPGQGDISGDVHINDYWQWVHGTELMTLSKPPLVPVLVHEFGHSLGLRHDTFDNMDIMYPSFDLGKPKNQIGHRSISRAQDRYGARMLPEWLIKYFIERRSGGWDFR